MTPNSKRWGAVSMLAAAETIVWASLFYTFPIMLLRWESEFGWERSTVSLALTLAITTSALTAPFAGRLIDRGHGPLMLPMAAFFGGSLLLTVSVVETQIAFIAVWAMIGVAMAGCFYESCFAFLTRARGTSARGAITLVTLVAGFASTICFPIASTIADAEGWRIALRFFGGATIFVAVPLFIFSVWWLEQDGKGITRPTREEETRAAKTARGTPAFRFLACAFPTVALTHGMIISHLIPLLEDRGAAATFAVLAASLIGPSQVAGRLLMAVIGNRRQALFFAVICFFLICAAALILLGASGSATMIFIFVVVFGSGYGTMSIVRPLLTADLLGRSGFGAISGALALPYVGAFAAAPFVASLLWRAGGYSLMLAICAALALIGLILTIAAARAASKSAEIDPARHPH